MKVASLVVVLACASCGSDAVLDLLPGDSGVDTQTCGASCSGACVDLANDPLNCGSCGKPCVHNQLCATGACECLAGMTLCGASCFDLRSDPDHCGGCNATPCASGERCENGTCQAGTCSVSLTGCPISGRTACVDLNAGEPYCGACGKACAPGEVCVSSSCSPWTPATPIVCGTTSCP